MNTPTDDRLDALLATWADRQRLDDGAAERLRRAVVAEPRPVLAPAWWSGLSAQVTSAVVLAGVYPGHPGGRGALAAA